MKFTPALVLFVLPAFVFAQSGEIEVSGHVREVASGKAVKAKVVYKSLPTGSITGTINDTTYRFTVFGSSKYQVLATAEGYIPKAVIIDPVASKGTGRILHDLVLTPRGQTIRLEHLLFPVGDAVIDPSSFDELNEIAAMLIENPKMVVQLEGHTDNAGNPQANMKLSQQRVDAVKKYLLSKKVARNQVLTKAFGGSRPLTNGKLEEDREKNRRVELRVITEE